jgi:hypothetical protein
MGWYAGPSPTLNHSLINVLSGSGLVRFERSTDPQYSQRRVVHLRITKIVTPISRSTQLPRDPILLLKPEEGQLLTRSGRAGPPTPWACDIDQKDTTKAIALRVLWNNPRFRSI